MKRMALALVLVVPLVGCNARTPKTPVFEKVELERLLPLNAKGETTIHDPETISKLAAHFPELGSGKSSYIAGGWKAAYRLRFFPTEGGPHKVTVDSKGELWSEGNGDWRAQRGLKEFLDKLFVKEEDKRTAEF